MATQLTLTADRGSDGAPRVTAVGEIDLSNVEEFTQVLTTAVTETASADPAAAITVDLGAVKYVDSAGINALFSLADKAHRLKLIVHPLLMRALTISGLTELATVEPASPGRH
jgi:anti-sigma B factor antagonist